jgi:tRNA dimethylallyltransferase
MSGELKAEGKEQGAGSESTSHQSLVTSHQSLVTSHQLILILGPTAVGKTALSVELAKYFGTEIVSADARQFYKELEIGTAKPNAEELASVKHHLINSHSFKEVIDAGTFERLALDILSELFKKHQTVIAVGGSGLYIQALCEGLDPVDLRDDDLRVSLAKESIEQLQEKLKALDPEYYAEVDVQNPQRLMRALEIIILTGKKYSELRTGNKKARDFNIIKIGLNDDRELLYQRINSRVEDMLTKGLEEEAKALHPFKNEYALQTVGYTEWFDYFEGKHSRDTAIELIKRNTRRYAKRQLTWFRRDPEITWFHYKELELIIKHIEEKINNAH